MKKYAILLGFTILTTQSFCQAKFTNSFNEERSKVGLSITPVGIDLLNTEYNNFTPGFVENSPLNWDLAIEHKTKNLKILVNIVPKEMANTYNRIEKLKTDCECSSIKHHSFSENYLEFLRIADANRGLSNTCSLSPSGHKTVMFVTLSNGSSGYVDYYFFYNQSDDVLKAIDEFAYTFRFAPATTPNKEIYGIGIKFGYSSTSKKYEVEGVVENHTAFEEGVLPGDIIHAIEGKTLEYEDMAGVREKIIGSEGTTVKVQVFRNGLYLNKEIERKKLVITEDLKMLTLLNYDVYGASLCQLLDILCLKIVLDPDDLKVEKIKEKSGTEEWTTNYNLPKDVSGTYYYTDMGALGALIWIEYTVATGSESEMKAKYQEYFKILKEFLSKEDYLYEGEEQIEGDFAEITFKEDSYYFDGKIVLQYSYRGSNYDASEEYEIILKIAN